MRNYFTKSILIFSLLSFLTYTNSEAALIRSTGSGNWNVAGTWDLGRVPADGDEIIIEAGDSVTINSRIPNNIFDYLTDVTIAVRGTLYFSDPPGFFNVAALVLNGSSTIVVESGGRISSSGSGAEYIRYQGTIFPPQWSGTDGSVDGPQYIDNGGVNPGEPDGYIPLPIELISFDTKLSGSVIEINWATATELNNEFFTIERSDNGTDWSIIGKVDGAGDAHVRLDYQFIDYDPIPGMSYYRLKQTDFDGQFEYFDPSVILYEPENLLRLFPNPVDDYLNITSVSDLKEATIIVKNLNGKQENVTVTLYNRHQAQLEMGHLSTGVYLMEIIFPESVLTSRILKR